MSEQLTKKANALQMEAQDLQQWCDATAHEVTTLIPKDTEANHKLIALTTKNKLTLEIVPMLKASIGDPSMKEKVTVIVQQVTEELEDWHNDLYGEVLSAENRTDIEENTWNQCMETIAMESLMPQAAEDPDVTKVKKDILSKIGAMLDLGSVREMEKYALQNDPEMRQMMNAAANLFDQKQSATDTITLTLDDIIANAQEVRIVRIASNPRELCYGVTEYIADHTSILPTGLTPWAKAEGADLEAHVNAINLFTETCLKVGAQIYKERSLDNPSRFPLDEKEFVREMQDQIDEALRDKGIGNPAYGQPGAYERRRISQSALNKPVDQFNEERWALVDDIFSTIN